MIFHEFNNQKNELDYIFKNPRKIVGVIPARTKVNFCPKRVYKDLNKSQDAKHIERKWTWFNKIFPILNLLDK